MSNVEEIRAAREATSIFRGLFDYLRDQDRQLASEGRRSVLGGLLSKEPVMGTDTIRYEGLLPMLASLAEPLARGIDAPRAAAQKLIPAEDMMGEAFGTAGTAMFGGGAVPKPKGALGANALRDDSGFAAYLDQVNPNATRIPSENRPNLGMGDMYGMLPRDAEYVSDIGAAQIYRGTKGDYYATAYNPDLGEMDVVGYVIKGDRDTELHVVDEMQGKGIGSELQYLFRKENPDAPTGGLTDAGEASLFKTYNRLRDDGIVPANANASTGALVLGMQARAEPGLLKILTDRGVDPDNADRAPFSIIQEALNAASRQDVIDPRSANAILSHFAPNPELSDFYANASKGAGAAAMISADASKMTKSQLDPFGFQNTKMDKPLSEVEIQSQNLNENLPRQEADIEALEGKIAIPFYGDRSSRGLLVSGVDDVKFDQPVYTEGGIDFMVGPAAQADRSIWASDQGIITRLTNEAIDKAKADGKDVVGTTISMAPDAVDFTSFAAATMAEMVKAAPIKKKDAKLFDQAMKKADPNWPGVLSADLRAYVEQAAPGIRKVFIRSMDSKPAQEAGFPSPAKMRLAVTDPSQVEIPSGQTGLSLGQIDVGADALTRPSVPHSTYDTQMTGTYLGGIPAVPQGLLYRDFYKTMDGKKTKTGQPFSESHKTYAMKTVVPGQEFTPEIIEYLMKLRERQK